MDKVQTFKDLKLWQKSHEMTLEIYKITRNFPNEEKFGLVSQMRRAASSVSANIVEGHARKSRKDFSHFLTLAKGSLEETKYFLILSKDLGYISNQTYSDLESACMEVGRILYVFHKKLVGVS